MNPPAVSAAGTIEQNKPGGAKPETRPLVFRVPLTGNSAADPDAKWVEVVRLIALVVFPGLIVFSIAEPALAGRVVWTIAIASLPLFFVIGGYHRWRRICPLAFMSQIPAMVGLAGSRRAGPWLRDHGYRLAFAIFLVSLWLRLVATNGDGYALALFLGGISLAAFVTGLLFTGKTWCNYVCPVFFVEKLYTEPRGLRDTPNSQCHVCTACRPTCPDISEENSYWKEILLPDKRQVFYAFPGVVLAFYVYYFVQAGTWEYYFGGRWTHDVGLFHTAFRRGVDAATAGAYFWPSVPRAIAAAATLAAGGLLSLALFSLAEPPLTGLLRRRDQTTDAAQERHLMFSLAAFAAFIAFYSFAGAPTLRLVAGAPHLFQLLVVTTATLFLVRRLNRRQRDFSEEALARTFIARWPFTDAKPPRDLHEAFLVYNARSKAAGGADAAQAGVLDLYKIAVRETTNAGITSRTDVHQFDSLRSRLRITEADHERIMSELAEEEGALESAGVGHPSPEKRLQLDGYAAALAACLDVQSSAGRGIDDAVVRRLRDEYAVTADEHRLVLDRLLQQREGLAANVFDLPVAIEQAAAAVRAIDASQSPVMAFLSRLLKRRWSRTVDTLLHAVAGGDEKAATLRDDLLSAEPARRRAAITALGARLSPALAERLTVAPGADAGPSDEATALEAQLSSADPYIRATAFYILQSKGEATAGREKLATDDHPLVQETLAQAQLIADESRNAEPSTLEKMIAFCSAPLFEALEPEELIRLARRSTEVWFTQGETICREGDLGDEAFLVLAGEVSIFRHDGATDRLVGVEGVGTCIGELSVLDPAPRASTVVVASVAVRALRLSGQALRDARETSPAVSDGIIRLLVRRLRLVGVGAPPNPTGPRDS